MASIEKKKTKNWIYALIGFAFLCIGIFPLYNIVANIERNVCYPKVAQSQNIPTTFDRLIMKEEIYAKAKSLISSEMNRNDVLTVLETMAPIAVIHSEDRVVDGSYDTIELDICYLPINNVLFLVFYTNDGIFEEIRLIIED
jgi:hypothetical protein